MGTLLNRRRYMGGGYELLEDRIITTFNVVDESSATKICHTSNVTDKIESIEIDGVLMDTVSSSYQLSLGDHTIKIRMNDVTATCNSLFYDVTQITSVILPYCLKTIGDNTFRKCSNIESIDIPYGVTTVGSSVFDECAKLTEIIIPDTVTTFGAIFSKCSNIENIVIPATVTSLKNMAFYGCSKLKRINSNIDGVFYLPNVKSFGSSAFYNCVQAENIVISSEAASFGNNVFESCSNLKRLNSDTDGVYNLPLGQKTIVSSMFARCPIEVLNMATDITSIGGSAFGQCGNLKRINSTIDGVFNIPNTVTNIGSLSFRQTNCYDFHIPTGLTTLGASAFLQSKLSGNVVLPEGITALGNSTFESTLITSCDIPSTIASIGNKCFNGCSNLTSVVVRATAPPTLGTTVFPNSTIIYVPAASVADYQSAWSSLASRIQAIPT
jgi:hypothetical protein